MTKVDNVHWSILNGCYFSALDETAKKLGDSAIDSETKDIFNETLHNFSYHHKKRTASRAWVIVPTSIYLFFKKKTMTKLFLKEIASSQRDNSAERGNNLERLQTFASGIKWSYDREILPIHKSLFEVRQRLRTIIKQKLDTPVESTQPDKPTWGKRMLINIVFSDTSMKLASLYLDRRNKE